MVEVGRLSGLPRPVGELAPVEVGLIGMTRLAGPVD
jgi:hypothetical protein